MRVKSIKVNAIMNAVLTVSSVFFPLITFPYVSRVLLAEGMGKVSFATSLIAYFNLFAQLGIPTYGIRACAKVRDNRRQLTKTVHELMLVNAILTIVSFSSLLLTVSAVPRLQDEKVLYIVIGSSLLFNAIGIEWMYKALEQYTYITLRSIVFKLVAIAAMFSLVRSPEDYVIYGGITIFAASASNLLNFANARKHIAFSWLGSYDLKKHIRPVAIFFAMSCATTIYANMDTLLLGLIKTEQDVGFYNAAIKVKSVLVGVVTSIGAVLLPRASYYVEKDRLDNFWAIGKKALKIVITIAVPLVVYFILLAEECVAILAGDSYVNAIVPMQIIMPSVLFIGLSNILGIQMLVPLGREKTVLHSEIIGVAVNVTANLLLIPSLGVSGAAVANVLTELSVLVVQLIALRHSVLDIFSTKELCKALGGLGVASVGVYLLKKLRIPNFGMMVVTSIVFFGIYGLLVIGFKVIVSWTKEILESFLSRHAK